MATGTPTMYLSAITRHLQGVHDWEDDDHYVALVDSSYTPSLSHSTWADVSANEVTDVDYSPIDVTGESLTTQTSSMKMDCDDFDFGSSVTITARYAIVLEGTAAGQSGTDNLVGYILLDDSGADVSTTNDAFVMAVGSNGLFVVGNGDTVEVDTKFTGDGARAAWRAEETLLVKRTGSDNADFEYPNQATWSDGDTVRALIGGSANRVSPSQPVQSDCPIWDLTPDSDATRCVRFDGSDDNLEFQLSDGAAFEYLWTDVDKTLLFQFALRDAISGSAVAIAGNYFGTGDALWVLEAGSGELRYVIRNTTFDTLSYTWSGFAVDTLFNVAIRHTGGGATEILIDDMSAAVASTTLSQWSSSGSTPADISLIGARGGGSSPSKLDLTGYVFLDKVASQAELEDAISWIDGAQS